MRLCGVHAEPVIMFELLFLRGRPRDANGAPRRHPARARPVTPAPCPGCRPQTVAR
jgi:hypothetical protein